MRPELFDELVAVAGSGEACLFTGAGFSLGACDRAGCPLPDSETLRRELWRLTFGDDDPDDSSLADLFDAALLRDKPGTAALLEARLTVGDGPLPPHYRPWLAAPWRRIYTLNVDDLERVANRQLDLPRRLRSRSALEDADAGEDDGAPEVLDVVHLNGLVGGDVERVTFSTLQYADRLRAWQREYERLTHLLARTPFVFVGTTLDELPLWTHLLAQRPTGRPAPRSFLVTRSLSRARHCLLESFGITWIPSTAEDVARFLIARR